MNSYAIRTDGTFDEASEVWRPAVLTQVAANASRAGGGAGDGGRGRSVAGPYLLRVDGDIDWIEKMNWKEDAEGEVGRFGFQ